MLQNDGRTTGSPRQLPHFFAAALLALWPLAASAGILPERQTWQFMQSVGGISIGEPYRDGATSYLPVSCDVSGQTKITAQPTTLNSSLATADVDVVISAGTIYVTVVTTMVSHNKSTLCKPALLGDLPGGEYRVFYRDPDGTEHALGRIAIK